MTPARLLVPGLLLTATAGYVDAVGFIELGGYFVSFMSGNTTRLGTDLAFGSFKAALLAAGLLGLFFAGSTIGSFVAIVSGLRWGAAGVCALVGLSIIATLAMLAAGVAPAIAMLALAAGAGGQNAILPSTGTVRVGATFVTGTLYGAGLDLARALHGSAPRWRWIQHLLVWTALLAGALLGSLAYRLWAAPSLVGPALVYGLFTVLFLLRRPSTIIPH